MIRREFLQSAALVAAGHGLGLSPVPPVAAPWYAAHCAFCGYEFPDADPHVWSFQMPPGSPPYKLCSVCIWHGPGSDLVRLHGPLSMKHVAPLG